MLRLITFILICLTATSAVAEGPGQVPSPWAYGPSLSIFYNNGGVTLGNPVGGALGVGTINIHGGYYIDGSLIPGAAGSQLANLVYASPCGSSGTPIFRAFCNGDLPVNVAVTGTFGVTGATSLGAVSASGIVSGVGFSNYLLAPPPIGSTTPSTGAFSTLSASGTISGVGFSNYLASPPCVGCTTPGVVTATNLLANSSITVNAPGLVGDGTTNNNTALQAAFTAAANGGYIFIPCGVYKTTALMSVTIAAGKKFKLEGAGSDCTKIAVSGAAGGFSFTMADETAGVDLDGFTLTTDQANTQTAISIKKTTANVLNAYAAPISIRNVSMYGSDYPTLFPTKYWNSGISLNNVNNVLMDNTFFIGGGCVSSLCGGNAVTTIGKPSSSSYGVVFNIVNSVIGLCNAGVTYGDWIQGIFINNTNITGCQYGVLVAPTPTGVLDQLVISNSQINAFVTGVYADTGASGSIANIEISNNLFITNPSTVGIRAKNVVNLLVTGNELNGSASGDTAIDLTGTVTDMSITGNNISSMPTGILLGGAATHYSITGNTFNVSTTGINFSVSQSDGIVNGNSIVSGAGTGMVFANAVSLVWTYITDNRVDSTTPYSFSGTVTGLVIEDRQPRTIANLFSCQAGTNGSKAYINDSVGSAAPTYHLSVAGGGATTVNSPAYCDGSGTWKYD